MVTVEDIEREVAGSFMIRTAMNRVMTQLHKAVDYYIKRYGEVEGPRICKEVILGTRKLTANENGEAYAKWGNEVKKPLEMLKALNTAQKQYIFKRMGWDITEVK